MDEDDNNLASNRVTITNETIDSAEEAQEDFDDDDDLLDTIEVTVTTDGAPLPRDDNEDIEIINLATNNQQQQHQQQTHQTNANPTTARSATSPHNINTPWPWQNEDGSNAPPPPPLNLSDDHRNWPWDNDETEDDVNFTEPSTSTRANALISAISVISSQGHNAEAAAAAGDEAAGGSSSGSGVVPSYCFDTSSFCYRTRKEVAAFIVAECCSGGPTPDLNHIMDRFFNPSTPIDNPDNISWIRWLIAGGRTISDFVKIGK